MTSTATLTLTDFLLARIAEDEAVAREANGRVAWLTFRQGDGSMRYTTVAHQHHGHDEWITDGHEAEPAQVFAFYDSARVLAECEAKRRLIRWVQTWPWRKEPPSSVDGLLPILALPYADHPDYREEWRP